MFPLAPQPSGGEWRASGLNEHFALQIFAPFASWATHGQRGAASSPRLGVTRYDNMPAAHVWRLKHTHTLLRAPGT